MSAFHLESPKPDVRSRAQHGEDLLLAGLFEQNRVGTFVEAGAFDGERMSNTWFFEHELGWNGLLVEPIPGLAQNCREVRPNSHVTEAVLGRKPGTAELTIPRDNPAFSTTRGADHLELRLHSSELQVLTVPQLTLTQALHDAAISSLDLLVLDVEDAESAVLAGFDFSQFHPQVIMLERDVLHFGVVVPLVRAGYSFHGRIATNDIWDGTGRSKLGQVRSLLGLVAVAAAPTARGIVRILLGRLHLLKLTRRMRSGSR